VAASRSRKAVLAAEAVLVAKAVPVGYSSPAAVQTATTASRIAPCAAWSAMTSGTTFSAVNETIVSTGIFVRVVMSNSSAPVTMSGV
jgi:hypothetical protein